MQKIILIKIFTCILLFKISILSLSGKNSNFNVPDSLIHLCSDTTLYIDSNMIIMPIWTDGIPNDILKHPDKETINNTLSNVNEYNQNRTVTNVSKPGMIIFPAAKSSNPNPAVLIFPGGRLVQVGVDREGINIARKLIEKGITAIYVKYRTGIDLQNYDEIEAILSDGRRAVSVIRSKAGELNIDPDKIGVLGCSAGGVIISNLAIHGDNLPKLKNDPIDNFSCRPNFTCNLYPILITSIFSSINSATPPALFIHGTNDQSAPMSNSTGYLDALQPFQNKSKLITFNAGHGFGYYYSMTGPVSQWISLFTNWLTDIGVLDISKYEVLLDQPKSLVFDEIHNQYFVCNYGNHQILKLDSIGILHSFIDSGLIEPTGLLKIGDTLFAVNKNYVSIISITENKILSEITIPTSSKLESIITDGKDNLYISDTEKNILFKLNLTSKEVTEFLSDGITPGVLFYNKNHHSIIIGNSGEDALIQEYFIENSELVSYPNTTLIQPHGFASDNCGNIVISSWYTNSIYIFDENFSQPPTRLFQTLPGPAQINLSQDNLLAVPNQNDNTIDFFHINNGCGSIPNLLEPLDEISLNAELVSFDWEDVSGRTCFELEISTDSMFLNSVTRYKVYKSDTTLKVKPAVDYFWRVRTVGGQGKDIFSDFWHFLTGVTNIHTYKISPDYYPNPTSGIIYFSESISNIDVYNLIGEKVIRINSAGQHQIDLSGLPKGMYILDYTTIDGINKSEKLVIK